MAPHVAAALNDLSRHTPWAGDGHPVFADPRTGQPVARTPNIARYRQALQAAQLDPAFRFHDLRHTFGTAMAATADLRAVQAWMGHEDSRTTQIYSHYAPEAARGAAGPGGVAPPSTSAPTLGRRPVRAAALPIPLPT